MIRTFRALQHVNTGFTDPSALQTFRVSIPDTEISDKDRDKVVHLEQDMMNKLGAVPGVQSVGLTSAVPMSGYNPNDLIFAQTRSLW